MNKKYISKMGYKRVRTYPLARRIDRHGVEHPQIDDVWLITQASRTALELQNPRSDQRVRIGTNRIKGHMPDVGRSDGILNLKSQIFLFERGFDVKPLPA
jgi:hypothetical protein